MMKHVAAFLIPFSVSGVMAYVAMGVADSVRAQQPAQQAFVPIVLDAAKFDAFYNELREVSMPARAFQQITTILQNLERQAQAEKQAADEAAKPK